MESDLSIIYKYFSHHIRNCTALIVSSVSLIRSMYENENQPPQTDESTFKKESISSIIEETAYILDIFCSCMPLCFYHAVGLPKEEDRHTSFNSIVKEFNHKCSGIMRDKDISFMITELDNMETKCDRQSVTNIIYLILYEIMLNSKSSISVTIKENTFVIETDGDIQPPKIWNVFKQILEKNEIKFTHSVKYILEYAA